MTWNASLKQTHPRYVGGSLRYEEKLGLIVLGVAMLFILALGIIAAIYFGEQGEWVGVGIAAVGTLVIEGIIFWVAEIAL